MTSQQRQILLEMLVERIKEFKVSVKDANGFLQAFIWNAEAVMDGLTEEGPKELIDHHRLEEECQRRVEEERERCADIVNQAGLDAKPGSKAEALASIVWSRILHPS